MTANLETYLADLAARGVPLLADTAIKGAAVLVLASLAALLLRRASAAARQLVWFLAISSLLVLPVLSLTVPAWRVLPSWARVEVGIAPPVPKAAASATREPPGSSAAAHGVEPAPIVEAAEERRPPRELSSAEPRSLAAAPVEVPEAATAAPAAAAEASAPASLLAARWSLVLWAGGTLACLVPLVLGKISLWRLGRHSRSVDGGSWGGLLARAQAALGFRRDVRLLESDRRAMPMLWGLWRPRLLVPAEAESWPALRRWVVLLHELAHAKRWDCATKLLAHVACAVYWFNPLAWLAFKRMQTEAEAACDDLVLASGHSDIAELKPSDYATHLLEIASGFKSGMLAAYSSIAMTRRSKLEGRLLAILDGGRSRRRLTFLVVTVAVLLLAGLAVPLAMLHARDANQALAEANSVAAIQPATQAADAEKAPWGEAVRGLQVRVRTSGAEQNPGEGIVLDVDVKNSGQKLTAVDSLEGWLLIWDGQPFLLKRVSWEEVGSRDIGQNQTIIDYTRLRIRRKGTETEIAEIRDGLVKSLYAATAVKPAGATWTPVGGRQLDLSPGKHSLSLSFALAQKLENAGPTSAMSNRVEVRILKPATQPAADAAEIDRLIQQLGSEKFAERDAAQKALVEIGEPALGLLKAAAMGSNAERALRAQAARAEIEFLAGMGPEPPRVRIRGRVLDQPGGRGVQGIHVILQTGLGFSMEDVTGSDGSYEFGPPSSSRARPMWLWISDGNMSESGAWRPLVGLNVADRDMTASDLHVRLPQSISGIVRDAQTHAPVPNAEISISGFDPPNAPARANKEGLYCLYLPASSYTLHWGDPEDLRYLPDTEFKKVVLPANTHLKDVDLSLAPSPKWTGVVHLPDGKPAANVDVWVQQDGERFVDEFRRNDGLYPSLQVVKTDSAGKFTAGYVREGPTPTTKRKAIAWTADRTLSGASEANVGPSGLGESKIVLAPSGRVVLRVLSEDGQPVQGTKVYMRSLDLVFYEQLAPPPKDLGDARFEAVVVGGLDYQIMVSGFGNMKTVSVKAGDQIDVGTITVKRAVARDVRALIEQLADPDVLKRCQAASSLGHIAPKDAPAAVAALVERLTDEYPVRCAAVEALGRIGPPARAAVPALIRLLREDFTGPRHAAAEVLGVIGDPRALPVLDAALTDKTMGLREKAAVAIRRIRESGSSGAAIAPVLSAPSKDSGPAASGPATQPAGRAGDSTEPTRPQR